MQMSEYSFEHLYREQERQLAQELERRRIQKERLEEQRAAAPQRHSGVTSRFGAGWLAAVMGHERSYR